MLKRYKNALFTAVELSGLSRVDFETAEGVTSPGDFVVTYRPAGLEFIVIPDDENPDWFNYELSRYTGDDPVLLGPFPDRGNTKFDEVETAFKAWLNGEVRTSIEESLLPDLWQTAQQASVLTSGPRDDTESGFSPEERDEIRQALKTFRLLVTSTFDPSPEEAEVIDDRIAHLTAAVDRLNRFDWKGVAISTLFSIVVALNLDTEKGRQLYGLFQQAFTTILHLLR